MSIVHNIVSTVIGRKIATILVRFLSELNKILFKREDIILFYAPEGNSLTDNSRALFNYLLENNFNNSYRIICCIPHKGSQKNIGSDVKIVGIIRGIIIYLTTKYVLYSFGSMRIKAAKSQVVVNLTHGAPLKSLGKYQVSKKYGDEDTNDFTYVISPSPYFKTVIANVHECSLNKVLINGQCKSDYLFSEKKSFSKLKIDSDNYNKTILWMPTFRVLKNRYNDIGDHFSENETLLPLLSKYKDIEMFNKFLYNNKILLAIKVHPGTNFNNIQYSNIKLYTNDILESYGVELYEFVKEFDALLTDYSSITFDYLLLNRPIGFTVDDFELYKRNRGFSVENPLKLMPGHHIETVYELRNFFLDVLYDNDKYQHERIKVSNIVNYYKDGNNRKRLLKHIGII